MALSKLEAKAWLKEIGFSDEKVEQLAAEFTAAQMTKIAEGYARQSDYSRAMDENRTATETAQAELAAASQRLNEEMAAFAVIQAEGGTITKKMREDLQRTEAQALKLRQKLEAVATDAGLNVADVLKEVELTVTAAPTTTTVVAPDLTGYVRADDLSKVTGQLADMALTLPAELQQIADEHHQLFGTRIDTRTIVTELKKRAGTRGNQKSLDPRVVWNELHNVETKRSEVAQKAHDDEIAAAVARGREEALSQAAIPGGSHVPGKASSPVLGGERKSALSKPQPGGTVAAAASAFRLGKYRTGTPTTA